jgi:hypothetical protein
MRAIPRIFLLGCTLALSTSVLAESDPTDLIKYRKNVMSALGGHAAAAGLIIRGKVDYNPQLVKHARSLAATTTMIKDIFPPDSELEAGGVQAARHGCAGGGVRLLEVGGGWRQGGDRKEIRGSRENLQELPR